MKVAKLLAAMVVFGIFSPVQAVEKNKKVQLDAPASSLNSIEFPVQASQSPRVRIPVQLTPYSQVVTTDNLGRARMMAKPGTTLKHHLRARIERPNHFYVGSWHIESIPEQWNKKDHTYQVKLRFFKRYGEGKHLEEYVGSSMVKGRLVGEKDLYLFQASHKETFNNRDNQPVLVVGIGPVSEKDDRLSKVTGKAAPSAR